MIRTWRVYTYPAHSRGYKDSEDHLHRHESGGYDDAAMPKPEFIVAASIDTEKWLKLKAAPPLAMTRLSYDARHFDYRKK